MEESHCYFPRDADPHTTGVLLRMMYTNTQLRVADAHYYCVAVKETWLTLEVAYSEISLEETQCSEEIVTTISVREVSQPMLNLGTGTILCRRT